MNISLILPWFPIVLAVGVGARLLDRVRGTGFGILGALFWVVLVQAAIGPAVFAQAWALAALIAGSAAIVAIGSWSGAAGQRRPYGTGVQPVGPPVENRCHSGSGRIDRVVFSDAHQPISAALSRFDDWLEDHRYVADPWPEFGELLRVLLYDLCEAAHVHPYRMLSEDDGLVPLRAMAPGEISDSVSARDGILGHVITSGVSYVAGDQTHGSLVDRLAEESGQGVAWCFAINQGPRRIGLVKVGQLSQQARTDTSLLSAIEKMVCLFWTTLSEVCRSRIAETRDPASGLLTREPFLIEADRVLGASFKQNEPVALAVFALEGTRALCDRGDWELADKLIGEASSLLEESIRADDRLGRFDDSRFVLLLRRVDSALGRLIVDQLLSRLTEVCEDQDRWGGPITVRCGLSGSGTERPLLTRLISRAVGCCNQARRSGVKISSDLQSQHETAGNVSSPEQVAP